MAKKAFNLGDYLQAAGGVQSGHAATEQIVLIELDRIDPDPNNFYSLRGIDELAANIELVGLLDALRVRPNGERFTIVSGHRRRAALQLIRDGGSEMFADGVPCIVEYGEASEAMRELRLIYANASTRVMSPADLSKQAERVEALLYELKKQGVEFPGRMRDHVAEACKVSAAKIGRLKAIRAHIDKPLLQMFDDGKMNESVAYALSQKPVEQQRAICDAWLATHQKLDGIPEHFVNEYAEDQAKLEKRVCNHPCNKGGVCVNKDEILARLHDGKWDYKACRYGTCCVDCSGYLSCKSRCPFVEDKAKAERERKKEANKQQKAAEKAEAEHKVFLIEHLWAQFGAALSAAGLTDKELRASLKDGSTYNPFECYMDEKRKAALLDFSCPDVSPNERLPYFYGFQVGDYVNLCKLADALDVSIDYLFLRDDVPNRKKADAEAEPVSGLNTDATSVWQQGTPPLPGRYLCMVDLGTSHLHEQQCEWDGRSWSAYGRPVEDVFRIVFWVPLPARATVRAPETEEEEEEETEEYAREES